MGLQNQGPAARPRLPLLLCGRSLAGAAWPASVHLFTTHPSLKVAQFMEIVKARCINATKKASFLKMIGRHNLNDLYFCVILSFFCIQIYLQRETLTVFM